MTAPTAAQEREVSDLAAPLDLLLTRAASGMWRRFVPSGATVNAAKRIASQPTRLTRTAFGLAGEHGRILLGRSSAEPAKGDRRFAEPAWSQNPFLKRILQSYLVTTSAVEEIVADLDLNDRDRDRVQFVIDNLIDALAPSNNPGLNPLFWKALIDTGGISALRGVTHLISDVATSPRVPAMVDTQPFRVGRTVAATPGVVVLRTPSFELLRYTPTTEEVSGTPLVIVPPVINKYYVVDLAPGRSLVEYLVAQGHTVFAISWRNPDTRHRDWGFETYVGAVDEAVDVALSLTGAASAHLLSLCSGGALSAMYASRLASLGHASRVATFSLAVAVIDQTGAGTVNSLSDEATATSAVKRSASKGYLDGAALAEVFAWLRPNDLVWNYWINNYLQGRRPPAFDILFWNADTTRMAAALHRDFVDLFLNNKLAEPDAAVVMDTPIDLSRVTADSYVVAGISDHICPWQACYRSTNLLGGASRFVLSRSGHVACIVNPPTSKKATYRTSDLTPESAQEWLEAAEQHQGSWWVDYSRWLAERSDAKQAAPDDLGSELYPVLETAPGSYVYDG